MAAHVALVVVVPALLVGAAELLLRLFGYGYPTSFFVKTDDGQTLTTNRRFGWRFMAHETATQPWPVNVQAQKPSGTFRIFVLGESAAQGTPAPAFGFARILEAMLQQQFPGKQFEIVNAAMRGINSHAIRPIAAECAALLPDVFLIYMGNNETVGLYAPEPGKFTLASHRWLIRANQWAKSLKLGLLVEDSFNALAKSSGKRPHQDMDFFRKKRLSADALERAAVYDNFHANLDDICRATRASGAKVIVSTVAVNLKDFPPLASLHRAGLSAAELGDWEAAFAQGANAEARGQFAEAITNYAGAARVDDHFAELHFRLARCCLAENRPDAARKHFALARDWDALQFRTDGRLNAITRDLVAARQDAGLVLLDAERAFADHPDSERGIPGNRFFHEHVHFNFDGDYLLAQTFLPMVAKALGLPAADRPVPSRQECAAALAFTKWDEISVAAAAVRMTGNPPFLDQVEHEARQRQAEESMDKLSRTFQQQEGFKGVLEAYRTAAAQRPHDWQIHFNFGNLLKELGLHADAVLEYAAALRVMPAHLPLRVALAQSLVASGRREEAIVHLREALRLDPMLPAAKESLTRLTGLRQS